MKDIISMAEPSKDVTTIFAFCDGGYTTDIPLSEGMKDNVLLAYELDDKPLPLEHGGPLRLVPLGLYASKAAKLVRQINFQKEHELGYWEQRDTMTQRTTGRRKDTPNYFLPTALKKV